MSPLPSRCTPRLHGKCANIAAKAAPHLQLCALQQLREIADACCSTDSPCSGILQDVMNGNSNGLCDEPGTHCSANGELTHVDLSSSNMKCELIAILRPLAVLGTIEDVQLSGNQDVTGSLDDTSSLRNIERWKQLQVRRWLCLAALLCALACLCTICMQLRSGAWRVYPCDHGGILIVRVR